MVALCILFIPALVPRIPTTKPTRARATVHFQLDGTCRCRWRDGSWTNGRWHERTETVEERGGPCELCEELREDEA